MSERDTEIQRERERERERERDKKRNERWNEADKNKYRSADLEGRQSLLQHHVVETPVRSHHQKVDLSILNSIQK